MSTNIFSIEAGVVTRYASGKLTFEKFHQINLRKLTAWSRPQHLRLYGDEHLDLAASGPTIPTGYTYIAFDASSTPLLASFLSGLGDTLGEAGTVVVNQVAKNILQLVDGGLPSHSP
jgi:hypothetical protein